MDACWSAWVSEWVSVWQQFSNCSAISWREQVHFQWDGDDFRFVLDQYASWIFLVLAHWNNSSQIDMSPHSDTLSWFRANHSLLFFLNAACLAEKQQIPKFHNLWFDPIRTLTLDLSHSNHYTTDVVHSIWTICIINNKNREISLTS